MALYPLLANGRVVELSATNFPVHGFVWGGDVSNTLPQPQVGWIAVEAGGVWSYAAPAGSAAPQQPVLRAQLAALDATIPRGLEDYWSVAGFETSKLPAATQAKLAQKQALRQQLAALVAAKTP